MKTMVCLPKISYINRHNVISRSSILKKRCYCDVKKSDDNKKELQVTQSGSKTLWNQLKEVRQIQQTKGKFDIQLLNYSPHEYELIMATKKDIIQALPVMALFWTPIIGYLTPVVCLIFPGILPASFLTPQQQDNFRNERHKLRITSRQHIEAVLEQHQPITDTMWTGQLGIDNLNQSHLAALSDFHGVGKRFFPGFLLRRMLTNKALYIDISDKLLIKHGLSSLTPPQLQQICFDRDLLSLPTNSENPIEPLQERLQHWLSFRKSNSTWTPSWTLHMVILQPHKNSSNASM